MKDMLNTIYTEICGDPAVSPYPIKYYDYPEAGDGETFVVIKRLALPVAAFGASDKELPLPLIHISEPTRQAENPSAGFSFKKKITTCDK